MLIMLRNVPKKNYLKKIILNSGEEFYFIFGFNSNFLSIYFFVFKYRINFYLFYKNLCLFIYEHSEFNDLSAKNN